MNYHRCLRQGLAPLHRLTRSRPRRLLSNASPAYQEQSPPAATPASSAQPFSTPFSPSSSESAESAESTEISTSSESSAPSRPKSSLPAGTALRGLAFLKHCDPPVAKEDHEYPDWLWGLLDQGKYGGKGELDGGSAEGDAFSKSAKQRRIAAKLARRSASTSSPESRAPPVPLHQQSGDLPSAPQNRFGRAVDIQAAEKAREAREELTASLRQKRRKTIREDNFLRGMK
ncbi:MAG: hypothetical protein Q9207_004765 [Kuettlingeria erythrocarpa]